MVPGRLEVVEMVAAVHLLVIRTHFTTYIAFAPPKMARSLTADAVLVSAGVFD
jgi:hypothetical protein